MSMDAKPLDLVIDVIRSILDEFQWHIDHISTHNGRLSFPDEISDYYIHTIKDPWPLYYEKPDALSLLATKCLLYRESDGEADPFDEFDLLSLEGSSLNVEPLKPLIFELEKKLIGQLREIKDPSAEKLSEYFEKKPRTSSKEDLVAAHCLLLTFIVSTHDFLALTSYGCSMTDLVKLAKNGNDKAFSRAVSIDKTVLFAIPFFRDTLLSLQLGHNPALLKSVAAALGEDVKETRFTYPEVNITFSILHKHGLLSDLKPVQLLSIFEELRIYSTDNINDISTLKSRFLKKAMTPD